MLQVRHKTCNARLFDSQMSVENISGSPSPDISIKCPRCSREQRREVIVSYRVKMPMRVAPELPTPLRCSNLRCLNRIMDLSLGYTLVDHKSHLEIVCAKCGEHNHVQLDSVIDVQ